MALSRDSANINSPLIVTNEEHRFLALEQLREIGIRPSAAILELGAKNTSPALTLAALDRGDDPVLVVTPADQPLADARAFTAAHQDAVHEAAEGAVVILGVTSDRPETGYGCIQSVVGSTSSVEEQCFDEKLDGATSKHCLADGCYYGNACMFVLKASLWLQAIETFRVDIASATRVAWAHRSTDAAFVRPGKNEFSAIPSDLIDYAVIERCPGSRSPIRKVPVAAGWNELGAWDEGWSRLPKDAHGNAHAGDVLATDCCNTLVHCTGRPVALVGVQDLAAVETTDAVLVANRSRSQDVKHIVGALQRLQPDEQTLRRKVHRPWGWYDSIDEGGRFRVKRIQVKPGASLSLQMHHHCAEHWVVVSGTAEITCGDKKLLLTENQSTYIPLGGVHRLANPGAIQLEIIEVQSGSYLGEDDIVRFEDTYGRVPS